MEMKDFFFYSAPSSPRSASSILRHHHHSSLLDYDDDDDDVAVLDDVPLLSHKHDHGAFSSCKTTTCNYDEQGNDEDGDGDEDGMPQKEQAKDDFEFCFSGQLDMMVKPSLSSADELFDGGKIRPLKLKVKPDTENRQMQSEDQHPIEGARCSEYQGRGRGRDRATNQNTNTLNNNRGGGSGSGSGRKGISRSLSPLRVSEFALLQRQHQDLASSSSCSRKWRLKDLFLFRSASEGHYKDTQSFSKRWSFRSPSTMGSGSRSGSGSGSGSESKRRGQVQGSAHEMHYTKKRAVSEEMKKKTSLPYKHGLLACLGFSPILPQFSYTFPSTAPTLS